MEKDNLHDLAKHVKEKYTDAIGFSIRKNFFTSKLGDADKMCWIIKKNIGGTKPKDIIDTYYWDYNRAQEQYQ